MSKVKMGDTVRVHYQALSKDGVIFDSTTQLTPLQITVGKQEIIPAFEQALVGMQVGEKKDLRLASKEAFGPYLQELVTTIARSKLPPDIEFRLGQHLQVQQPNGSAIIVKVVNMTDDFVTFDANHPLADKDLTFHIQLVEILQ
jgi:peptidylprolyl isomerase